LASRSVSGRRGVSGETSRIDYPLPDLRRAAVIAAARPSRDADRHRGAGHLVVFILLSIAASPGGSRRSPSPWPRRGVALVSR
jgi:hypothetical protein